jgi:hypothetical protein
MKHRAFIGFIIGEILILLLLFINSQTTMSSRRAEVRDKREIVKKLMLTDVAIWTEARYTRNPSQADFFSAFQDFPSSLEHFPAGSVIAPGRMHELTEIRVGKSGSGATKR